MSEQSQDHPAVSLHPPTVFFSALIIGFVIRIFAGGWLPLPEIIGEALGGILLVAAFVLAVMSISAFAESGETLQPATPSFQLLTGGAYQRTRNPIYLAMVLFGAGFGLATLNLWMILMAVAAGVLFNYFVIPQEEDYLARRFGEEYNDYRRKVRRWI
ncbi:MAG: methyltransferase family protein [Hyphococcus sp.]